MTAEQMILMLNKVEDKSIECVIHDKYCSLTLFKFRDDFYECVKAYSEGGEEIECVAFQVEATKLRKYRED